MDIVALDRFELIGALGSGADYEVRAATDLDTGMAVVLKRPSPQAVSRQMHGPIEERTTRILEAYEAAGQHSPGSAEGYWRNRGREPRRILWRKLWGRNIG